MNGARASGNVVITSVGIIDYKTGIVTNDGTWAIIGFDITTIAFIFC